MKPSSRCGIVIVLITLVIETSSQCEHTSHKCEVQFRSHFARGKCTRRYCDTYRCSTEYSRGYEVHIFGVYKPIGGKQDLGQLPAVVGDVEVNIVGLPGSDSLPLKLILSSYEAVHWKIYVPLDRPIEDIQLYSFYESYCTIHGWGHSTPPSLVRTRGYFGYGETHWDKMRSAVQRRFGFITSLSGTSSTESWNLTVGVKNDCTTTPESIPDGHDVRLVDGGNSSGTVQVFVDDVWVELLETQDSLNTATVVCRQLFDDRAIPRVWKYNQCPTRPLWVASCDGSEERMSQCGIHPLRVSETTPACNQTALKVECDPVLTTTTRPIGPFAGDLRLVDGGLGYGRVEVYYHSLWGTICDDGWGVKEAAVVCSTLGFRGQARTRFFGEGTGNIWLVRVDCRPTDSTFLDCSGSKPLSNHSVYSCTHAEDIGVECTADDAGPSGLVIGLGIAVALSVIFLIVIVLVVVKRTQNRQSGRAVRYHPSNESANDEVDIQNIRNSMRESMLSSYVSPADTAQYAPGPDVHPPAHSSGPPPPDNNELAPPTYREAVIFSRPRVPSSDTADPPAYDALFSCQSNDKDMSSSNI